MSRSAPYCACFDLIAISEKPALALNVHRIVLGKLLIIILMVGATASALLVNRQKRIETFHEMSQIHRRLHNHEYNLWKLRMQIAGRCRPSQVRLLVDRMESQWIPIPAPGSPVMSPPVDARLASNPAPKSKATEQASNLKNQKKTSGTKPASSGSTSQRKKPSIKVASNARDRNRPG